MKHFLIACLALLVAACASPADAGRFKLKMTGATLNGVAVGSGWSGATSQPADQNGGTTNAIAAWSNVPYQTFSGNFTLRVAAYHAPTSAEYLAGVDDNVDHVDFACEGGAWKSVYSRTGPHGEFEAVVRAPDVGSDKLIECRAIAWPTTGRPFVLQGSSVNWSATIYSMFLNANAGGTLPSLRRYVSTSGTDVTGCGTTSSNPCQTLMKGAAELKANMAGGDVGGGEICLMDLGHKYGVEGVNPAANLYAASTQWTTIKPCPGVAKSAAGISSSTERVSSAFRGAGFKKVHIQGITVADGGTTTGGVKFNSNSNNGGLVWFDDIDFTGPGITVASSELRGASWEGVYATNVVETAAVNCYSTYTLMVDVSCHDVSSNVATNPRWVFGLTVTNLASAYVCDAISLTCASSHPDVFECQNCALTNVIFADVVAASGVNSQEIFNDGGVGDGITDAAFVGGTYDNQAGGANSLSYLFQWAGTMTNTFFKGVNLRAGNIKMDHTQSGTTGTYTATVFVNSLCGDPSTGQSAGVTYLGGTCAP